MGLFSFIGKTLGKVAKAGLSVATRGVSDKVLKMLKGSGPSQSARAAEAMLAKTEPYGAPRTSRTEATVPGWGFSPDGYGGEQRKRMPGRPKFTRGRGRFAGETYFEGGDAPAPRKRKPRAKKPKAPKAPRKPAKPRSGVKRAPPTGGLDLKALSASWKAAGKPGTWQGWIQANK